MKAVGNTFVVLVVGVIVASGCKNARDGEPESASGVKKLTVEVPTDAEGNTSEQHNIRGRYLEDNKPGAIKHLYVISALSGDVIIYSTVRGKATSGGKRLTPTSVVADDGEFVDEEFNGIKVKIGGKWYRTSEVLQDDGTYGTSMDYIYWWDTRGVYHQHYISGGQIVHISNQPLSVPSIIINMELTAPTEKKER